MEAARLTAVPFDLPANETHGFWVDLYVPTSAVPGEYHGVYRVTAGGGREREIPVSLTVWNFALPQTPSLATEFGSPRLRDYYRQRAKAVNEPEPADWTAVEAPLLQPRAGALARTQTQPRRNPAYRECCLPSQPRGEEPCPPVPEPAQSGHAHA